MKGFTSVGTAQTYAGSLVTSLAALWMPEVTERGMMALRKLVTSQARCLTFKHLNPSSFASESVRRSMSWVASSREATEIMDLASFNEHHMMHACVGGLRSAEEILADGCAVSMKFHCVDLCTVGLSILRYHGIPCRLAWVMDGVESRHEVKSGTCNVQVPVEGGSIFVSFVCGDDADRVTLVGPNQLSHAEELGKTVVVYGKDFADTGLNFLSIMALLSCHQGYDPAGMVQAAQIPPYQAINAYII